MGIAVGAHRGTNALLAGTVFLTGLIVFVAALRVGLVAVALPAAALGAVLLLQRPRAALALLIATLVIAERRPDGLFTFMTAAYSDLPGTLFPVDLLLILACAAVALELLREGREPRLPPLLMVPLLLLVLATASGIVVGFSNGAGPKEAVFGARAIPYLVLVPILVASAVRTRAQVRLALAFGLIVAIVKAVLGLAAVSVGAGVDVAGATITWYAPIGNWLTLLGMLGVVAALLLRAKVPWWALLGTPLLTLSLVLSLRRSFWVAGAFALILVIVLGASPSGRRMLLPAGLVVAATLFLLAGQGFTFEGPVAERVQSLQPSKVQQNAEDRYRLDERANVVAEIERHPITGLGLGRPWHATERSLPVEQESGRNYVHMVLLWHWLKLGLLGMLALVALFVGSLLLAWRTFRREDDARMRAFGLAAFTGIAGLIVVESTASFTGVDPRMSGLLGAVLGLLGALSAMRREAHHP